MALNYDMEEMERYRTSTNAYIRTVSTEMNKMIQSLNAFIQDTTNGGPGIDESKSFYSNTYLVVAKEIRQVCNDFTEVNDRMINTYNFDVGESLSEVIISRAIDDQRSIRSYYQSRIDLNADREDYFNKAMISSTNLEIETLQGKYRKLTNWNSSSATLEQYVSVNNRLNSLVSLLNEISTSSKIKFNQISYEDHIKLTTMPIGNSGKPLTEDRINDLMEMGLTPDLIFMMLENARTEEDLELITQLLHGKYDDAFLVDANKISVEMQNCMTIFSGALLMFEDSQEAIDYSNALLASETAEKYLKIHMLNSAAMLNFNCVELEEILGTDRYQEEWDLLAEQNEKLNSMVNYWGSLYSINDQFSSGINGNYENGMFEYYDKIQISSLTLNDNGSFSFDYSLFIDQYDAVIDYSDGTTFGQLVKGGLLGTNVLSQDQISGKGYLVSGSDVSVMVSIDKVRELQEELDNLMMTYVAKSIPGLIGAFNPLLGAAIAVGIGMIESGDLKVDNELTKLLKEGNKAGIAEYDKRNGTEFGKMLDDYSEKNPGGYGQCAASFLVMINSYLAYQGAKSEIENSIDKENKLTLSSYFGSVHVSSSDITNLTIIPTGLPIDAANTAEDIKRKWEIETYGVLQLNGFVDEGESMTKEFIKYNFELLKAASGVDAPDWKIEMILFGRAYVEDKYKNEADLLNEIQNTSLCNSGTDFGSLAVGLKQQFGIDIRLEKGN